MVCGKNGPDSEIENCVCVVLSAIVDAQNQVFPSTNGECEVSCERSIKALLKGVSPTGNAPNTIPVILYCDCDPFLGTGVRLTTGPNPHFDCVQTFLFRVNSVDEECCASLELLTTGHNPTGPNPNPCDQFPGGAVNPGEITGTGICITVDLNCFCAVTCLEPISL